MVQIKFNEIINANVNGNILNLFRKLKNGLIVFRACIVVFFKNSIYYNIRYNFIKIGIIRNLFITFS